VRRLPRRAVLRATGAVLSTPALSRYAHAAEITWRLGHVAPTGSPLHLRLQEAAAAVAKRSDGAMELTIIGEGQAGIQSGLLAQVRGGGMEMTAAAGEELAAGLPLCTIPAIGFLFDDYATLWPAIDGELGQMIRSQFPSKLGMDVLARIWDFGFSHVTTSTRPVQAATDIAGLKIRTRADTDQMDMFRALDATPVAIALPYLYAALEHHQIDGQDGTLSVASNARLSEVQKHCGMTYHAWDGIWLCVNSAAWRGLPERLRHIVENALNGAAQRQRQDNETLQSTLRASLTASGMAFNDVDQASFRDTLRGQGYYARIRMKLGESVWDVVRKTTGVAP
jgi:tripartite ATP-independent transporter DctP family solute receptor